MNFETAFKRLLNIEGGYSDHKDDPGGKTRFGVTEAVARANSYTGDMKNLPVELAQKIYKTSYWDAVKADQLPELIRYAVFDCAVNSGVGQSIKFLQRAVGVKDDGIIGTGTINAISHENPEKVLRLILVKRLRFMKNLSTWSSFSRGWAERIAELLES